MSEYSTVLYEVEENIARITMNRPDNLNGITNTMMRELYETTGRAAEDPDVRVVIPVSYTHLTLPTTPYV